MKMAINDSRHIKLLSLLSILLCSLSSFAAAQDNNAEINCVAHDFSEEQWGRGYPRPFNFPSNIGAAPRSEQVTCVQIVGIAEDETHTIEVQRRQYEYRINDGQWLRHSKESTFGNNDRIYLRTTVDRRKGASGDTYLLIDGNYSSSWAYQVENTGREPKTWQVGPERRYKQLTRIQDDLVAGDIVELDGDATYDAVEFTRSGVKGAPITIRGITVNGQRPVISGNISQQKQWTVAFNQSHYYVLDNMEITGGTAICLRNMAHQVIIKNTYIHECDDHGVLGTDEYSGTLILDHVEIEEVGYSYSRHAVYVATDGHRFPDSKLRVEYSYIHEYSGNGIKSRAYRTELLYNWIEQSEWVNEDDDEDHSYYSIELIGPDGYEPDVPLEQLVVGNVFEHKEFVFDRDAWSYGMRFGGDGTGYSWGRVWFTDNIIISAATNQDAVFRTQFKMNSVYMKNNLFIRADLPASQWEAMLLFENTADEWYEDEILIFGENNWYPDFTDVDEPGEVPETVVNQWQRDNDNELSGYADIFFDSNTGEIQIPANSNFLTNGVISNQELDSLYQVEGFAEYDNQPYQGYLARPKFEHNHTIEN